MRTGFEERIAQTRECSKFYYLGRPSNVNQTRRCGESMNSITFGWFLVEKRGESCLRVTEMMENDGNLEVTREYDSVAESAKDGLLRPHSQTVMRQEVRMGVLPGLPQTRAETCSTY